MTVEDKLGVNKFHVDERNKHIEINRDSKPEDILELTRACPAGLYKYSDGVMTFDCAGCFECGTCRILSAGKVISGWSFPKGGMGIEYRFG